MNKYKYFIKNKLPFLFRYKYSKPNKIRTVYIKGVKKNIMIAIEGKKIKKFRLEGVHFDTSDLLPVYT